MANAPDVVARGSGGIHGLDDQFAARATALEREHEARHRYWAAVFAATESLRHAEWRFHELSVSIDAHIESARAALGSRALSLSRPVS